MIFLTTIFSAIACFLIVTNGMSLSINIVKSDSMSPTLVEGDIVAWTPAHIEDVEVGDVIVFKSYIEWPDEKIIVHRVTDILTDGNGNPILETKGDNNNWFDQAGVNIAEPYIQEDHLMGKILSVGEEPLKIPYAFLISICLICMIVIILSLFVYQMWIKTSKEQTFVTMFD